MKKYFILIATKELTFQKATLAFRLLCMKKNLGTTQNDYVKLREVWEQNHCLHFLSKN